jgi:hypothetical protein
MLSGHFEPRREMMREKECERPAEFCVGSVWVTQVKEGKRPADRKPTLTAGEMNAPRLGNRGSSGYIDAFAHLYLVPQPELNNLSSSAACCSILLITYSQTKRGRDGSSLLIWRRSVFVTR